MSFKRFLGFLKLIIVYSLHKLYPNQANFTCVFACVNLPRHKCEVTIKNVRLNERSQRRNDGKLTTLSCKKIALRIKISQDALSSIDYMFA